MLDSDKPLGNHSRIGSARVPRVGFRSKPEAAGSLPIGQELALLQSPICGNSCTLDRQVSLATHNRAIWQLKRLAGFCQKLRQMPVTCIARHVAKDDWAPPASLLWYLMAFLNAESLLLGESELGAAVRLLNLDLPI
jgi:hypothetical protein